MEYITSPGESCFTPAQEKKLAQRINAQTTTTSKVATIHGVWLHYTHLRDSGEDVKTKIEQLLGTHSASFLDQKQVSNSCKIYYITPRNLSPWSSKATSIAHVCGLKNQVHRIERGRAIMGMSLLTNFKEVIITKMNSAI
jgi:phosphoribosylformylglycinamidine synthase